MFYLRKGLPLCGEPLYAYWLWIQEVYSLVTASRDFEAAVGAMIRELVVIEVWLIVSFTLLPPSLFSMKVEDPAESYLLT